MRRVLIIAVIALLALTAFDKQQDCFQQSQDFIWSCVAGGQSLAHCTQQAAGHYCNCMGNPPNCNGGQAGIAKSPIWLYNRWQRTRGKESMTYTNTEVTLWNIDPFTYTGQLLTPLIAQPLTAFRRVS